MKNEYIEKILKAFPDEPYPNTEFEAALHLEKAERVKNSDQIGAKQIWIYETIHEIQRFYLNAFNLLKIKNYYDAWCQLERIEITFSFLKKHFAFDKVQYHLWSIERAVKNLQVIYPYRIFLSSEILKKRETCSVCNKEASIRNPCGHVVGDIYNGEMCYRTVTEAEILGASIVENPGNKYSVAFIRSERTNETIDQYNYATLDYLFQLIESPDESWDLEVSQREVTKADYGNANRNDPCPCNSGKKFKHCCIGRIGEKYPHYEFLVKNPNNKFILTDTLGKENTA